MHVRPGEPPPLGVQEMHVDGFRFDLASTLARELYDVLIAEPRDIGMGGYQVGNFPVRWCEWNGTYRDTVRDCWRGENQTLAECANRLTGSADLYQDDGRRAVREHQFRNCPRPVHAARSRLVQREAQRSERRRNPRRRKPQPFVELRRRRTD